MILLYEHKNTLIMLNISNILLHSSIKNYGYFHFLDIYSTHHLYFSLIIQQYLLKKSLNPQTPLTSLFYIYKIHTY